MDHRSAHLGDPNPAPIQALAAGMGLVEMALGRRKATGSITYAGNLTEGDTVTINGVEFTAVSTDAGEGEFEVDQTLSATLDNLVAAIGDLDDARLDAVVVTKNAGSTGIDVVAAEVGAAGNNITLAAEGSSPTVSGPKLTGGVDEVPITGLAKTVNLITLAGGDMELDLPNGRDGQEITLFFRTKGTSANMVVNGTFAGGTKATFDAAGDMLHLKWLGDAWRTLVNTNVTIA